MKRRSLALTPFALALICLTAGCATDDSATGDFYRAGFSDGCRTGEARQSSFSDEIYRSEGLFKTEPSYRAGWRSGFAQCNRMNPPESRPSDLGEQESF